MYSIARRGTSARTPWATDRPRVPCAAAGADEPTGGRTMREEQPMTTRRARRFGVAILLAGAVGGVAAGCGGGGGKDGQVGQCAKDAKGNEDITIVACTDA